MIRRTSLACVPFISAAVFFACTCDLFRAVNAFASISVSPIEAPITAPSTQGAPSAALPTPAEIKSLFAAGKYREALDADRRLLNFRGVPAPLFDHREMILLRAECLIQMKEIGDAVVFLDPIIKSEEDTGDAEGAAQIGSLALLLRRSVNGIYTPQSGMDRTPIDIIPVANRSTAFPLLFGDEFAAYQSKVSDAHIANTVAAISAIGKNFDSLRCLERFTSKGTPKTDAMAKDMAQSAALLITQRLDAFSLEIRNISQSANQIVVKSRTLTMVDGVQELVPNRGRRGLLPNNIETLRLIAKECGQWELTITPLLLEFKNSAILVPVKERAQWTLERANTVASDEDDPGDKKFKAVSTK